MVLKEVALMRYRHMLQQKSTRGNGGVAGGEVEQFLPPPLDFSLFITTATLARFLTIMAGWPIFLHFVAPGTSVWQFVVSGSTVLTSPAVLALALFYWACNIGLSVLAILLVQQTSAAATVLANVAALPLSALLFCCPLPLLERQPFHWRFGTGLVLVAAGNLLYNWDFMMHLKAKSSPRQ
mmetsp:Transcript_71964/g.199700  ORF Transcript_71964/g.199700 Transcript_71964/m.199700 type:complete len:181 (-) Transcript_71964:25-567(-)